MVGALARLIEADRGLRAIHKEYQRACVELAGLLKDGHTVVAALETMDAANVRRRIVEVGEEFELARHDVRVHMVALAREEGATFGEIGRTMGVSRQLISRFSAEIGKTQLDS